ncbi:MAG: beta-ketoacyl synthase N-terminal-like domain-containing protein, partial [Spirochaetota bacterium]
MKRSIAVTGLGIICPVGNDVDTFWKSLKEGKSGIGKVTRFDPSGLDAKIAAEVKDFDPSLYMDKKEARKMALFTQYAVAASVQAWKDAGLERDAPGSAGSPYAGYDPERIAVCLGNGIGGLEIFQESYEKLLESGPDRMPPMTVPLMISNEASANVAIRLGIKGPAFTQVTACASGTDAIGQAIDLLRSGRVDVVVAGGTEAAITVFAMGGF